jgi:hypothetical protein
VSSPQSCKDAMGVSAASCGAPRLWSRRERARVSTSAGPDTAEIGEAGRLPLSIRRATSDRRYATLRRMGYRPSRSNTVGEAAWGILFEGNAKKRLDDLISANNGDIILISNTAQGYNFTKQGKERGMGDSMGQHGSLTATDGRVPLAFWQIGLPGTEDGDDNTFKPIEDFYAGKESLLDSPVEVCPIREYFGLSKLDACN